jgi:hypothetical protein
MDLARFAVLTIEFLMKDQVLFALGRRRDLIAGK